MPIMAGKVSKKVELYNKDGFDELFLYGTIGQYADIQAVDVKAAIEKSGSGILKAHINSFGGEVFESIAIYNMLKTSGKAVEVYVDGVAASGASVVAMAGEKIIMPGNAMMFIHNAWTFACGDAAELKRVADDLEKMDKGVNDAYKARFTGTDEELKGLLDDEAWLTAEECKALGFCDEIADEPEEEGKTKKSAKASILSKYAPGLHPEEISEEEKRQYRAEVIGSFLTAFYEKSNFKEELINAND